MPPKLTIKINGSRSKSLREDKENQARQGGEDKEKKCFEFQNDRNQQSQLQVVDGKIAIFKSQKLDVEEIKDIRARKDLNSNIIAQESEIKKLKEEETGLTSRVQLLQIDLVELLSTDPVAYFNRSDEIRLALDRLGRLRWEMKDAQTKLGECIKAEATYSDYQEWLKDERESRNIAKMARLQEEEKNRHYDKLARELFHKMAMEFKCDKAAIKEQEDEFFRELAEDEKKKSEALQMHQMRVSEAGQEVIKSLEQKVVELQEKVDSKKIQEKRIQQLRIAGTGVKDMPPIYNHQIMNPVSLEGREIGGWAQRAISQHLGLGVWSIMRPRFVVEFGEEFIKLNDDKLYKWWKTQSSAMANAANKETCARNKERLLFKTDEPVKETAGLAIKASITKKLNVLGKRIRRGDIRPLQTKFKALDSSVSNMRTIVSRVSQSCAQAHKNSVSTVQDAMVKLRCNVETKLINCGVANVEKMIKDSQQQQEKWQQEYKEMKAKLDIANEQVAKANQEVREVKKQAEKDAAESRDQLQSYNFALLEMRKEIQAMKSREQDLSSRVFKVEGCLRDDKENIKPQ